MAAGKLVALFSASLEHIPKFIWPSQRFGDLP
jgi:hypothetical protein